VDNFRDCGGILVAGGGAIRAGALYRGDAPRAGDPPPAGVAWPPRTVVDLRSSGEAVEGHPLAGPGVDVRALPLRAAASLPGLVARIRDVDGGLVGLYRGTLADAGPRFAEIAAVVADADGPVLVHCTAGKDRTGMVIAVLLSAVGAPREAVIADYVATRERMPGVLRRIETTPGFEHEAEAVRRMIAEHPDLVDAPAPAVEAMLDVLEGRGGAAAWLTAQGLPAATLVRLRARLVQPD
jgi:protein-tyrosine phosphatase